PLRPGQTALLRWLFTLREFPALPIQRACGLLGQSSKKYHNAARAPKPRATDRTFGNRVWPYAATPVLRTLFPTIRAARDRRQRTPLGECPHGILPVPRRPVRTSHGFASEAARQRRTVEKR